MEESRKINLDELGDVTGGNYHSGDFKYCKKCGFHLPKNQINAAGYCAPCYNLVCAERNGINVDSNPKA